MVSAVLDNDCLFLFKLLRLLNSFSYMSFDYAHKFDGAGQESPCADSFQMIINSSMYPHTHTRYRLEAGHVSTRRVPKQRRSGRSYQTLSGSSGGRRPAEQ